ESSCDRIDGIRYDSILRRQRLLTDRVVHKRWGRRGHAIGLHQLVGRIVHLRMVIESLIHDRFYGIVILFGNRLFQFRIALASLLYVAFERAAERHHVNLLPVQTDLDDFPGRDRIASLPNWNFPRSGLVARGRRGAAPILSTRFPGFLRLWFSLRFF